MFRWDAIVNHFKEMRGYISFGFILFLAGIVIGGTNPAFKMFIEGQIAGIQELSQMIDSASNPTLTMMIVIFLNNAIKSIFIIFLGAFLGVLPIIFLVVNGMVIGFILQGIANQPEGPTVIEVIVKGLLPHGIIEIPAIIIACAYGMKLGALTFKGLGSLMFARAKLGAIGRQFEILFVRIVPVIVILTVALLVASIIESTFTVWLLEK